MVYVSTPVNFQPILLGGYQLIHVWYQKKIYKSPLTNYVFGVAMKGLLLKLHSFKKVKLIFGHPVHVNFTPDLTLENGFSWAFKMLKPMSFRERQQG